MEKVGHLSDRCPAQMRRIFDVGPRQPSSLRRLSASGLDVHLPRDGPWVQIISMSERMESALDAPAPAFSH